MKRFSYTIKEEQGIHARPASFLIQEARTYESHITIRVKGKEADASNIIRCRMWAESRSRDMWNG